MQAINPINNHAKFGKDRINTFPSNERKPSVWTPDGGKSKNNMSTPHWGGHNKRPWWPSCFSNEAKNIPRQDLMVMNISYKFEKASYNIFLLER